jgi:hypothetical protein
MEIDRRGTRGWAVYHQKSHKIYRNLVFSITWTTVIFFYSVDVNLRDIMGNTLK